MVLSLLDCLDLLLDDWDFVRFKNPSADLIGVVSLLIFFETELAVVCGRVNSTLR